MVETSDQELGKLAIEEGRRTLDNQFRLVLQKSRASVEMVKLNFIVAGVLIASVNLGTNLIPENLVLGVFPLIVSAALAIIAYIDSIWKEPHYGITVDFDKLRGAEFDSGPISSSYENMVDKNKRMLRRESWLIVASMGIFLFSVFFILTGYLSGII